MYMFGAHHKAKVVIKIYFVSFSVSNLCLFIKHVWANLHLEQTAMIKKYYTFFINI